MNIPKIIRRIFAPGPPIPVDTFKSTPRIEIARMLLSPCPCGSCDHISNYLERTISCNGCGFVVRFYNDREVQESARARKRYAEAIKTGDGDDQTRST